MGIALSALSSIHHTKSNTKAMKLNKQNLDKGVFTTKILEFDAQPLLKFFNPLGPRMGAEMPRHQRFLG